MIRTTGDDDIVCKIAEASAAPTGGCYNRAVRSGALVLALPMAGPVILPREPGADPAADPSGVAVDLRGRRRR